ncbi:MAG: hypothetical protein HY774_16570 [Acidobacteria bacterium]|nr:hypothetical protein [Acidobacteriota bacterium]
MSNASNVNCSDLEKARQISHKLSLETRLSPPTPRQPPAPPNYICFHLKHFTGQSDKAESAPPDAPVLPSLPPLSDDLYGKETWEQLLKWCLEAINGSGAFLIDREGFVVANQGLVTPEKAQEIGARLTIALDQAQQLPDLPETSPIVAFEQATGWVTGFNVTVGQLGTLQLGLLGPVVAPRMVADQVRQALS